MGHTCRCTNEIELTPVGLNFTVTRPGPVRWRVSQVLERVDFDDWGDGDRFKASYTAAVVDVLELRDPAAGNVAVVRVTPDPARGSVDVETEVMLAVGSKLAAQSTLEEALGRRLLYALQRGDTGLFRRVGLAKQEVVAPRTTRATAAATTTTTASASADAPSSTAAVPARPTPPPDAPPRPRPTATNAPATTRGSGAASGKGGGAGGVRPTGCQPWGQPYPPCAGLALRMCALQLRCVWIPSPPPPTPATTTTAAATPPPKSPAASTTAPTAPETGASSCAIHCSAVETTQPARLRRKGRRTKGHGP